MRRKGLSIWTAAVLAVLILIPAVLTACTGANTTGSGGETTGDAEPDQGIDGGAAAGDPGEAGETDPSGETELAADEKDDGTLKKTVGEFNWKLYDKLEKEGNLFYSPFSIVSALAIADLAAAGETKAGIEEALCIEDLPRFCRQMKLFRDELKEKQGVTLYTANSIWIDEALPLNPACEKEFREPAEYYFGGDFRQADFRGKLPAVRQEISDWVKEATGGFLTDYESGAGEDTAADILNAVYFFGEWQTPFPSENSGKDIFHGLTGDTGTEMMEMTDVFLPYLSNQGGISAIALPYADGDTEMVLMIPAEGEEKSIGELFRPEAAEELFEALDRVEEVEIRQLKMPKFRMDLTLENLPAILGALGMDTAFSENADFSLLADQLCISDILQRAKVEVDEEGSRAAAVTEVVMRLESLPPEEPEAVRFIVDRPFLFVIRNRKNGICLFTGRVNELKGP